jgi:hypothetical protein
MYATVRRYRTRGSASEVIRRVERDFVPQVKRIPGLVSYTVVEIGEALTTFSVFTDRDSAEESNRISALWVNQHLADLVELPAQVATGEVLLHETPVAVTR